MKHNCIPNSGVETLVSPVPDMAQLIQDKICELEEKASDEAFFIGDVGDIIRKFKVWKKLLPRVEPFYAVKCNSDDTVLQTLADLGTGFDCASKTEISQILKRGVSPSRIVYANPCKQKSYIKYANKHGVDLMTFDNEAELIKTKELFPSARLVLRILPTSQVKVQCELGNKFGCHPNNVQKLLSKAQELDLNVMGISFHVGSGVEEAKAFTFAVKQAYDAWQTAVDLGFDMTLLDIGGGFPGDDSAPVSFEEIACVLNEALEKYFPSDNIQIISEPGRYFVASAFTLAVNIIAKRTVARDISDSEGPPDAHNQQNVTSNDEPSHMYYINDGVYGSFNSLLYDHATVQAHVISDSTLLFSSSVWGPTCDGLDCVKEECWLPEMEVGDWMFFPNMGAYTMCAGSSFNGMPRPGCYYVCSTDLWCELYPESEMPPAKKKRCDLVAASATFSTLRTGPDALTLREAVGPIKHLQKEEVVQA